MEKKKTVRRETPSFITEKEVFPTRLREIMDKRHVTPKMLAEYLGVSSPMVNQYRLGQSFPKMERLMEMAEYFHVTVNYLLGFSGADTDDEDVVAVCDYTGLSPDAVRILHNGTITDGSEIQSTLTSQEHFFALFGRNALNDFINSAVASSHGPYFLTAMLTLAEIIEGCNKEIESFSDPRNGSLKRLQKEMGMSVKIKELRYQICDVQDALRSYMDEVFHASDTVLQMRKLLEQYYDPNIIDEAETIDPLMIDKE